MRISDWSSDVCSSDLPWSSHASSSRAMVGRACAPARAGQRQVGERTLAVTAVAAVEQHWGAPDRKSVVEGKSVSVRVDLGGRRNIKKKTQQSQTHESKVQRNVTDNKTVTTTHV